MQGHFLYPFVMNAKELREENELLKKALEFYADKHNYCRHMPGKRITAAEASAKGSQLGIPLWDFDDGAVAREALKKPT